MCRATVTKGANVTEKPDIKELKDLVRYPLHIDCIHYKIKTRVNTR